MGVKIFNQFSLRGVYLCAGTGTFRMLSLLSDTAFLNFFDFGLWRTVPWIPLWVSTSMVLSPRESFLRFVGFLGSKLLVSMLTSPCVAIFSSNLTAQHFCTQTRVLICTHYHFRLGARVVLNVKRTKRTNSAANLAHIKRQKTRLVT
jgi:hypothetical protein